MTDDELEAALADAMRFQGQAETNRRLYHERGQYSGTGFPEFMLGSPLLLLRALLALKEERGKRAELENDRDGERVDNFRLRDYLNFLGHDSDREAPLPEGHAGLARENRELRQKLEALRELLVGRWHADAATAMPLHEYMGMSEEEYKEWFCYGGSMTVKAARGKSDG